MRTTRLEQEGFEWRPIRLSAVTVCVDYSPLLSLSIEVRKETLDYFLVVTCSRDEETKSLCGKWGIDCHVTDVFYDRGAHFNKYAAIVEAVETWARPDGFWSDWNIFLDADILLPKTWRTTVESSRILVGNLYGCRRVLDDGRKLSWEELAGYFQMFHASDPNAQRKPLLEIDWIHAGGGDSEFQLRWPEEKKRWLPFPVRHIGEIGQNWFGKGKKAEMQQMLIDRATAGRVTEKERIR